MLQKAVLPKPVFVCMCKLSPADGLLNVYIAQLHFYIGLSGKFESLASELGAGLLIGIYVLRERLVESTVEDKKEGER